MKIKSIILISILMICVVLISCQKTVKPDTPENTGSLMDMAIINGHYEMFSNLFSEGRKNIISRESFDEIKKIVTLAKGRKNYHLLTYDNGEMLLITLTPDKVKGEYKIEDLVIVPNEMKEIFK